MARPAKSLLQHVRTASFRARRHAELLVGSQLEQWPVLAELQRQYRAAADGGDRGAIALEFERLVRSAHRELGQASAAGTDDASEAWPAGPRAGRAGPSRAAAPAPIISRLALSPNQAAESLGVSRDFFDEHIAPELPIVRRGRRKLIAIRELERWLEREASLALGRTA